MLPQASGAAIARTPRMTGAFHGAMPSTTPAGWRIASDRTPGLSAGMTSPVICVVSAAASRSSVAAKKHVEAAPRAGRADLLGHQLGEKSAVRLSSRSAALLQQRAPLAGAGLRPGREGARGRLDDLGDVGGAGRRGLARDLAVTGSWRSKVAPFDAPTGCAVDDEINLHDGLLFV